MIYLLKPKLSSIVSGYNFFDFCFQMRMDNMDKILNHHYMNNFIMWSCKIAVVCLVFSNLSTLSSVPLLAILSLSAQDSSGLCLLLTDSSSVRQVYDFYFQLVWSGTISIGHH